MKFIIKIDGVVLQDDCGCTVFSPTDVYSMDVDERETEIILNSMISLARVGNKSEYFPDEKRTIEIIAA